MKTAQLSLALTARKCGILPRRDKSVPEYASVLRIMQYEESNANIALTKCKMSPHLSYKMWLGALLANWRKYSQRVIMVAM